jgi:hypothetical protein
MIPPQIRVVSAAHAQAQHSTLASCRILELPKIEDVRGNLSFVEGQRHIPFAIRRVYWVYDVPGGTTREGHAYYTLEELIIAASGSFDVVVDDGKERHVVQLNRSYVGLYIPPMVWRCLDNFSSNSVALILASQAYSEKEYLREYQEFSVAARR